MTSISGDYSWVTPSKNVKNQEQVQEKTQKKRYDIGNVLNGSVNPNQIGCAAYTH